MKKKSVVLKILILVFTLLSFAGTMLLISNFNQITNIIAPIALGIGLAGLIVSLVLYGNEVAKFEMRKQALREEELVRMEEQECNRLQNLGQLIEKTKILSTSTVKDKNDAMKRGIIGALLIGTPGAVIGTGTSSYIKATTFLVVYKNGKKEAIEVVNGTKIYNLYIQHLEV